MSRAPWLGGLTSTLCGSRCDINSLVPGHTVGRSALHEGYGGRCRQGLSTTWEAGGIGRVVPARAATQNPHDRRTDAPWEW